HRRRCPGARGERRQMRSKAFLAAALLGAAVSASASEPASASPNWVDGAQDWLDRIGPALVKQDYQGTLVTVSGNSMDTLGVFHSWDGSRERMRLVALTGPKREVIRDDRMVMCIGTGLASVGYDGDAAARWNPAE